MLWKPSIGKLNPSISIRSFRLGYNARFPFRNLSDLYSQGARKSPIRADAAHCITIQGEPIRQVGGLCSHPADPGRRVHKGFAKPAKAKTPALPGPGNQSIRIDEIVSEDQRMAQAEREEAIPPVTVLQYIRLRYLLLASCLVVFPASFHTSYSFTILAQQTLAFEDPVFSYMTVGSLLIVFIVVTLKIQYRGMTWLSRVADYGGNFTEIRLCSVVIALGQDLQRWSFSSHIRPMVARVFRKMGIVVRPPEKGKTRVRWRCVSPFSQSI